MDVQFQIICPHLKASNDENVPKLLAMMEHHLGCVNCIRWSGSGTFLASGGDDKLVSFNIVINETPRLEDF